MASLANCACGHTFSVDSDRETTVCPACGKVQFISRPSDAPGGTPVGAGGTTPEHLQETCTYVPPKPAPAKKNQIAPAVAFTIILVIFVGLPIGYSLHLYREAAAADGELRQLPQRRQAAQAQARDDEKARHLQLRVTGPATVQAGAPNAYRIETKNLADQPLPARLTVRVVDEAQQVVHEEKDIDCAGSHQLLLPRDLSVPAGKTLTLEVFAEKKDKDVAQIWLRERLVLTGPAYVTHVTTDKPMYRPGEVVGFRSLTLDRFSLRPPADDLQLTYAITDSAGTKVFELQGAAQLAGRPGQVVEGPDGKPLRGVGAGEYAIPTAARGGEYTLTVSEANGRFPAQQRKFLVNRYEKPRLHKELEWSRRSYGAGERAAALCKVARVEGGVPLANQPVTATVQIDGTYYDAKGQATSAGTGFEARTDEAGAVQLAFTLPADIERGEASLSVRFTDGGNIETLVRPIPIVVKKLAIDCYPEGGDLIAGLPNRVYFQARTPLGQPADLKGRVVDGHGKTVAEVQTLSAADVPGLNQGTGRFSFTPQAGQKYELKVTAPTGVLGTYPLPPVKDSGVVLSVPTSVTGSAEALRAVVRNKGPQRRLLVGAYARGRLLDHQEVTVGDGASADVLLKPAADVGGVFRVTAFEKPADGGALRPIAERLIYRAPARRLQLAVAADRSRYVPGETVRLTVSAADEKGEPAPAVVLLAVADQGVLNLADEKTARAMPTHFLLTGELCRPEDLEHADFLLSDHPKAAEALDLLLGTQGWRRFAEQDPEQFRRQHKDEADRLLAMLGQAPVQTSNAAEVEQAADAATQKRVLELNTELAREETAANERRTRAEANQRSLQDAGRSLLILLVIAVFVAALMGAFVLVARVINSLFPAAEPTGQPRSNLLGIMMLACFLVVVCLISITALGTTASRTFQSVSATMGGGGGGGWFPRGVRPAPPPPSRAAPSPPRMTMMPQGDASAQRPVAAAKAEPAPAAGPNITVNAGPGRAPEAQLATAYAGIDPAGKRAKAIPPPGAVGNGRFSAVWLQQQDRQRGKQQPLKPAGRHFLQEDAPEAAWPPFIVREYAHQRAASGQGPRTDFTETLYWHPALILPDGRAPATFELCDSVTSFHVTAYAHALDGRLGSTSAVVESRLPFSVEPKIPVEITANDTLTIPVTIANDTEAARSVAVEVRQSGLKLLEGTGEDKLTLNANQRARRLYRLQPTLTAGAARLRIDGVSGPFVADSIERTLTVVPDGFPVVGTHSDTLKESARHDIVLPEHWFPGTLQCQVQLYPSVLSDLQAGLEGLLREPFG